MTVLATVIVLGVLIFVHELGHFGAAKMVGIEVQRFSIGLGHGCSASTRARPSTCSAPSRWVGT